MNKTCGTCPWFETKDCPNFGDYRITEILKWNVRRETMNKFKKLARFIESLIDDIIKLEKKDGLFNENNDREVVLWKKDGMYLSAESYYSQLCIADYYGEFRGNCPWINPEIEEESKKLGLYLEWQDPGTLKVEEN